jgi:CHASE2 domain-containing sensor protein
MRSELRRLYAVSAAVAMILGAVAMAVMAWATPAILPSAFLVMTGAVALGYLVLFNRKSAHRLRRGRSTRHSPAAARRSRRSRRA